VGEHIEDRQMVRVNGLDLGDVRTAMNRFLLAAWSTMRAESNSRVLSSLDASLVLGSLKLASASTSRRFSEKRRARADLRAFRLACLGIS